METVIEYICAETTEDPAACVRCARFLADREACEAEVDESGNAMCKFVENETDPPGCCVVNAADGNGGGNGGGDGGTGGDGGRGGNVNVDGGNTGVWNGGE